MTETKIYTQKAWGLEDLFTSFDDPQYAATFDEVKQGVQSFTKYRDQLDASIDEDVFIGMITEYELIYKLVVRLNGFAQLAFAANTQYQKAQA